MNGAPRDRNAMAVQDGLIITRRIIVAKPAASIVEFNLFASIASSCRTILTCPDFSDHG
jgi:hypothetical protein